MNLFVNTKEYWDRRFYSGDWEINFGSQQTESLTKGQLPYINVSPNFIGTILDFGCWLGDSFSIYKNAFPTATFIGIDISTSAIERCKSKFSSIASFLQGDYRSVPKADIIITSNVLEHIPNDL